MIRWRRRAAASTSPAAPEGAAGLVIPTASQANPSDDIPAVVAAQSTPVVLISRVGCHLCDQAIATLGDHRVDHVVLDVDSDQALAERYRDHVPVTFVHGVLLSYWVLDPDRLIQALAASPEQPPAGTR